MMPLVTPEEARTLYALWQRHSSGVDVGAIQHLGTFLADEIPQDRWHAEGRQLTDRLRAVFVACEPQQSDAEREHRIRQLVLRAEFWAADEIEARTERALRDAKVVPISELQKRRDKTDALGVEKLSTILLRVQEEWEHPKPVISTPFPGLDYLMLGGFRPGELTILGARPGMGKALALDTVLPTPTGWTTMGEVSVGDRLIGADGCPVRVLATSAIQRGRKCYVVCFSDGTEIIADAEHQWITSTRSARKSWERLHVVNRESPFSRDQRHLAVRPTVVTTAEIAESLRVNRDQRANHSVRTCAAFKLPGSALPIDPYLLGVWLGDGCSASARFTSADEEIVSAVAGTGQSVTHHSTRYSYGLPGGLQVKLRGLGLLNNKHVPTCYLRASEKQRRALLAGLLDTDGTVNRGGGVQFSTTSSRLAEDVSELVHTLGYRVACTRKRVNGRTEKSSIAFSLNFSTADTVFKLSRKRLRHQQWRSSRSTRRSEERYIVDVRPVPSVPVRCVRVDAADSLYLASKSCIPTHNSALALEMTRHVARHGHPVLFVSREMSGEALARRLLAQEGRLDAGTLRTGKHTDWTRVTAAINRVYGLPAYITERPRTVQAITQAVREVPSCAFVVVDYLQILSAPGVKDRRQQVETISAGLKQMALECKVPVFVLSSLSRPDSKAKQTAPGMASLRDSGALEHDADTVMLLHREPKQLHTLCTIVKNRDALVGDVDLIFRPESVAFEELMSEEEERRYGN